MIRLSGLHLSFYYSFRLPKTIPCRYRIIIFPENSLLESHLDAMHNYISRKRVIGYHRTNYLNMIRYTHKLLAVNFAGKKAVEKWRTALVQEDILSEKDWFLGYLS